MWWHSAIFMRGVNKFLAQWLPKMGIETTFVDTTDYAQHERAIRPEYEVVVFGVADESDAARGGLPKSGGDCERAQGAEHGRLDVWYADQSEPGGVWDRPVMHSGTKYLAGHSDLICGVIAGRHELMEKIWETRTILGNCMDPHASWVLLRG